MVLQLDVGKIKFQWQGNYDAATDYYRDDVVYHDGSAWVCVKADDPITGLPVAVTGVTPATSATASWNKMAQGSDLGSLTGISAGDIIYYDGADFTRLGIGTAGQSLKVNAAANAPEWTNSAQYELARMTTETYTGGVWSMTTSYAWAPGAYIDYTPQHATTSSDKIEVHYNISKGTVNGYGMAHGRYYENGTSGTLTELARRSWQASDYHDTSIAFTWLHNGWSGANRVGWQFREYNSNHQAKLHSVYHFDGTSTNQFMPPLIIIKEWKAL